MISTEGSDVSGLHVVVCMWLHERACVSSLSHAGLLRIVTFSPVDQSGLQVEGRDDDAKVSITEAMGDEKQSSSGNGGAARRRSAPDEYEMEH